MEKKRRFAASFGVFFIGLIGLFQVAQRPRFSAVHAVDAIQLVASGMCFGAALTIVLVLSLRGRSTT